MEPQDLITEPLRGKSKERVIRDGNESDDEDAEDSLGNDTPGTTEDDDDDDDQTASRVSEFAKKQFMREGINQNSSKRVRFDAELDISLLRLMNINEDSFNLLSFFHA